MMKVLLIVVTVFIFVTVSADSTFNDYYNDSQNWSSGKIGVGELSITDTVTINQDIELSGNIQIVATDGGRLVNDTYQFILDGTNLPTTPSEVNLSPLEQDINHTTYFLLQIGSPMGMDVSVDYTTKDDTAITGLDYLSTSGVATITAGETHTTIGVEIIGDTIVESDETFRLIISNPQGASFPAGVSEISASKIIVNDD